MKPFSLILVLASIALLSCGQDILENKVPSVVLNVVHTKFTGASHIEWEKKKNYFEAEFDVDSIEHTLQIDLNGNVIEHRREITAMELPSHIVTAIMTTNVGYRIDDAAIIEKNGQSLYEIELESKGNKDKKVYFSSEGKVISKR